MSYSVIIADDEPLVLVGLQSMLDWAALDVEIVAQARNGSQLEEAISRYTPDIVITDISMPVKSGLDVLQECRENQEKGPEFILLTSYEEFSYVRTAIRYDAVEYLVKLELSEENLTAAINKAKARVDEHRGKKGGSPSAQDSRQIFRDRFFIRQFFQLGENETPLDDQIANLGLELEAPAFAVSYLTFPSVIEMEDKNKAISLCSSAAAIFQETVSRYVHCYTTVLDLGHVTITLCFEENMVPGYRSHTFSALKAARESVSSFFSMESYISTGTLVNDLRLLSESFTSARGITSRAGENNPIIFAEHYLDGGNEYAEIDSGKYRKELKKAFSEVDAHALEAVIHEIADTIRKPGVSRLSAIALSSDVLYMVMTLLPDGEWMLDEIFPPSSTSAGYRILYQLRSGEECASWLCELSDGLVKILSERKQDYRLQAISRIQAYINENITRRLSLGEIADLFGYSQGYLSSLFSKYAGINFVDYVTNARIAKAKELMSTSDRKVYEVAQELGFESSFYFSKVFKKVTGMSPSEYTAMLQKE